MYFFVKQPNNQTVSGLEAEHFIVMRVSVDDIIKITDLKGSIFTCKITIVNKKGKEIEWEIVNKKVVEKTNSKALFQAQTDRNYLEKMVEIIPLIGVTNIYIFRSDRSPKQNVKLERLEKILIRSCEQGELTWKPEITVIKQNLDKLIIAKKPTVLDCYIPEVNKKSLFKDKQANISSAIVGPEGGWSDKELEKFEKLDLMFYSMGSTIFPAWLAGYTYFANEQKTTKVNTKLANLGWGFKI